jgi:hypothetical protein
MTEPIQEEKKRFRFRFWRRDKPAAAPVPAGNSDDGKRAVTSRDLLHATIAVQHETAQHITEMERELALADEHANAAAVATASNREVLNHIDSELTQAQAAPEQTEAIVETLGRRMFRDKCFMLLLFMVVVLGVAAVIVTFVIPNDVPETVQRDKLPDETPAPSVPNTTVTNSTNTTNSSGFAARGF